MHRSATHTETPHEYLTIHQQTRVSPPHDQIESSKISPCPAEEISKINYSRTSNQPTVLRRTSGSKNDHVCHSDSTAPSVHPANASWTAHCQLISDTASAPAQPHQPVPIHTYIPVVPHLVPPPDIPTSASVPQFTPFGAHRKSTASGACQSAKWDFEYDRK